jgi:hypothetical protein
LPNPAPQGSASQQDWPHWLGSHGGNQGRKGRCGPGPQHPPIKITMPTKAQINTVSGRRKIQRLIVSILLEKVCSWGNRSSVSGGFCGVLPAKAGTEASLGGPRRITATEAPVSLPAHAGIQASLYVTASARRNLGLFPNKGAPRLIPAQGGTQGTWTCTSFWTAAFAAMTPPVLLRSQWATSTAGRG